jgi:putative ABC transport system permease protein
MSVGPGSIRYAVRKLARTPLFAGVALATLAVGIGATTLIFSVVSSVLLEPLPFPNSDRLVTLWHQAPGLGMKELPNSDATYFLYRGETGVFAGVTAYQPGQVNLAGDAPPERIDVLRVTGDYLRVLALAPVLGRSFAPDDDQPGAPLTIVLTRSYWQRRFGTAPDAVGRMVRIDGEQARIIGVVPDDVRLGSRAELLTAARLDPNRTTAGAFSYQVVARLQPDVSPDAALQVMRQALTTLPDRFPGIPRSILQQGRFAPEIRPLLQDVVGDVGRVLWTLFGAVAAVLLIACANVANLVLVRAEGRRREMAVRTALGAGRGTILVEYLTEGLVLGGLGGALGLGLALAGLRLLVAYGPANLPRLPEIGLHLSALGFAALVSAAAGLGFGLLVGIRQSRTAPAAVLREGGRGAGTSRSRHRVRNALVIAQVALALLLLVSSGLLVRSFRALRQVDPGFRHPDRVLTFRLALVGDEFPDAGSVARAEERILDRIAALPGVTHVGAITSAPMAGLQAVTAFNLEDQPVAAGTMPPTHQTKWVAGDYFAALGVPVLAGRNLEWADLHARARRLVVNEAFARAHWADARAAVGKRVRATPAGEWWEIVGVVGNVRDRGYDQPPPALAYYPIVFPPLNPAGGDSVMAQRSFTVVLETRRPDPLALTGDLRRAIGELWADLPLADVRTLADLAAASMARTAFTVVLLGLAALVALFLGAVGLYGVISYLVSERTEEIGVRMAFGADPRAIRAMVLRQALRLAAFGIGVGLLASLALTRVLASFLYGVSPFDPPTFAVVALVLVAVALLASWLPARRASTVDPIDALRAGG